MNECKVGDITILLLDIVKMSDKALLGYLVQCLYHRYVTITCDVTSTCVKRGLF